MFSHDIILFRNGYSEYGPIHRVTHEMLFRYALTHEEVEQTQRPNQDP
jgi:hypothetical protein